jgi:hypothetical protein
MKMKHLAVQLAVVLTLGLMSTAAFAQPENYRSDRISTQGRITTMTREGSMFRVTLNHGGYSYLVPASEVRNRNLRVGDRVRLDGFVSGDVVNANMIAWQGEPSYAVDPNYVAVPYGQSGWLSGTVQRTDRHLGFIVIRDDASGVNEKIDVRHMDLRHPVNVWGVRAGDHISVNGSWEDRGTFNANRIEY